MRSGRPLRALPAGPGLVRALRLAVAGTGPAVLPLPPGPPELVARLLAAARLEEPVEPGVALVVPTSGSTGEPKLAELGAAALETSARATLERLGGPECWLLALPLTHVAGLQVVLRAQLSGRPVETLDLSGGFSPAGFAAAAARLDGDRAYTSLVPTQLHRLVEAGVDLSRFAAILLGGAAAPEQLLERAAGLGGRVVRTYGMTETCGGCVYDGIPLDGVRVNVSQDGLVRLAGPVLASGYRMRPDLDREAFVDGWFVTSDLGELDATGQLRVLGRADDVIVSGGENVPAAVVEEVLRSLPGVRDAVVAGRPDAEWGQVVAAVVEVAHPTEATAPDELRAAVRARLGAAAVPRRLVVVPALPRTASGKPDRIAAEALLGGPET